jgi:type IV pilus assembly protein PilC
MAKETDFFLENLSILMRSSLPIREAVSTLKEEIRGKNMRRAITIIEQEIDAGGKISTALQKSKMLSERYVALLRLGEETGELQKQMALVVDEQKKEQALHSKIRGALIYPAIVILITICVGIFTMWYIFPRLTAVFAQSGGQLPVTTRIIIGIGNFLTQWGVIVVPGGFTIAALLIYFVFIYSKTRSIGERILLHTPVMRTIIQDLELARFGYVMGSLLHAGITVPQALISMQDSTTFVLYKRFYAELYSKVTEGASLYKAISTYPQYQQFVPSYLARLISAGEMSGSLSETLSDIGEMFEVKTENITQNLSVMLEPIIIVVVGLVVAFLAVAIISPIYGLTTQIN